MIMVPVGCICGGTVETWLLVAGCAGLARWWHRLKARRAAARLDDPCACDCHVDPKTHTGCVSPVCEKPPDESK